AGESWERIPLSAELPGDMVYIKATNEKSAEMVTDEGAIYVTSNRGYNWKAAVQESVSATLNRTVSSGISGASYYTGTFNTVNRSPDGRYVAVSSRGNFYLTWEPGQVRLLLRNAISFCFYMLCSFTFGMPVLAIRLC
ncbi:photosystem II stability/assembly factor HCF136 chloroplastic-like, partial [Trifolium medium]|nr:photosystem II stability/assembly factor HCF136 chloroplastic-like [Trifolium medium]